MNQNQREAKRKGVREDSVGNLVRGRGAPDSYLTISRARAKATESMCGQASAQQREGVRHRQIGFSLLNPDGSMPGKLHIRWTSPFWLTKGFNGSYQLGTLAGELLSK